MSGPGTPAILRRLQAAFDGVPVVLADLPVHAHPGGGSVRMLADHLVELANEPDGGVLVLGIDRQRRVVGVADPDAWTRAVHRATEALRPAPELEVEQGEERGQAIVAVRVEHGPARRRDAAVPATSPMLAAVPGSNIGWLDPAAMSRIVTGWAPDQSPEARSNLTRAGLLALDGRSITRVGLLLAGRPEHRARGDGVALTTAAGTTVLRRGWLLLDEELRAHCETDTVDLVVDLVTHVLVRTVAASARAPVVVEVEGQRLVIETSTPIADDPDVARRMARWATWEKGRWRETAQRLGVDVSWEKHPGGLRVVASLPGPTPPQPAPVVTPQPTSLPTRSSRETRESTVLALLADGAPLARRDIESKLGWSRSTLRNVLERLVSDGRLVAVVASNRSPFQAYRLACTASPAITRSPGRSRG